MEKDIDVKMDERIPQSNADEAPVGSGHIIFILLHRSITHY
jgi:hypothetical protein